MRLFPLVLAALLVLLTSPARGAVATGEAPPQRELPPDLLVLLLGPPRYDQDAQVVPPPDGLQEASRATKERSPLPAWILLVLEVDGGGATTSWDPETRVARFEFSGGFPTGADPPGSGTPSSASAFGYDHPRPGRDFLDFGFQSLRRELVGDDFKRYEMYAATHRHVRPQLARWLKRDPAGFDDGSNPYRWLRNNPGGFVDPDGRAVIEGILVVGGVTYVVVGTAEYLGFELVESPFGPAPTLTKGQPFLERLRIAGDRAALLLGPLGGGAVDLLGSIPTRVEGCRVAVNQALLAIRAGLAGGSATAAAAAADIWSKQGTVRGNLIEDDLARTVYNGWFRVGQLLNGKFDLVDFQKGSTLVSLKTIHTLQRAASGTLARGIRELESHILQLAARASVESAAGVPLATKLVLDIRVPPGGKELLEGLVQFGANVGVRVVIKVYP